MNQFVCTGDCLNVKVRLKFVKNISVFITLTANLKKKKEISTILYSICIRIIHERPVDYFGE